MVVEISFLRKCAVVVLLIPSVLALRCLSATMARTDSIALNESISDGQNLVSGNNKFVLGFFSPGTSSQRYIGIWYNSVPNGTVVWVGNRNNPVQDKSGILKFDNGSNLILVDGKGSLFTVASGVDVEDMEAAILDSGNFVLRSMMNPSNIVWESFAFPTDTWLPEMNITVGNFLTSWKSYDDPAMGEYTFGPGIANASQLYIWWNGHKFWTSAPWTGDTNSLIPDLTSISIIPVSFQCDKFTCKYTPNPKDRMTKIVLDRTGALDIKQFDPDAKSWTLLSRQPVSCDVSNLCGAYGVCNISMLSVSAQESVPPSLCHCPQGFVPQDQSNARKGCSRQTPLQCNGDGFIDMPHMQLPDCRQKLSVVENGDCQSACMNDCYCTAYINSPLDGCSLCHGNLTNLQSGNDGNGVGTLHLRLAASELKSSSRSGHRMILLAYILPSVAFLIFCLASFIWIRRWKNKGKGKQHDHSLVMASDVIKLWETEDRDSHFTTLSFSQIKIATDNFSTENKLGEGGTPVFESGSTLLHLQCSH